MQAEIHLNSTLHIINNIYTLKADNLKIIKAQKQLHSKEMSDWKMK
jgi:hypothetical protein